MNTLLTKAASAISGVALFCVGCLMAGLGLSVVALLALFALAAAGLALLAAPFVALAQPATRDDEAGQDTAAAA